MQLLNSPTPQRSTSGKSKMTICIVVKVNDGVVLASDSASTILFNDAQTGRQFVQNTYENANKVFNLIKGQPIGAMFSGAGSIGNQSIETLIKDFRLDILNNVSRNYVPSNYSVRGIVDSFKTYIFDEKYQPFFNQFPEKPDIYFFVAGYPKINSVIGEYPELWAISIQNGNCTIQQVCQFTQIGIYTQGQIEPIWRIYYGFSVQLEQVLTREGLDSPTVQRIITSCYNALTAQLIHPAMPIQDAINLAAFLVDMTENFWKYVPGVSTVAGPIEIATITKHEGFKWINRKHFFDSEMNRLSSDNSRGV